MTQEELACQGMPEATIIGVSLLASCGRYHVTFERSDGYIYSETWPAPPAGYRIDHAG